MKALNVLIGILLVAGTGLATSVGTNTRQPISISIHEDTDTNPTYVNILTSTNIERNTTNFSIEVNGLVSTIGTDVIISIHDVDTKLTTATFSNNTKNYHTIIGPIPFNFSRITQSNPCSSEIVNISSTVPTAWGTNPNAPANLIIEVPYCIPVYVSPYLGEQIVVPGKTVPKQSITTTNSAGTSFREHLVLGRASSITVNADASVASPIIGTKAQGFHETLNVDQVLDTVDQTVNQTVLILRNIPNAD